MFKVEAVVNGDQLETLLLAAKAAGVTLSLGVVPGDEPSRQRKSRGAKRSTKGKQEFPAKMQVRVGSAEGLSPGLAKAHGKLKLKFGSSPFRKALAKGVLHAKGGSLVTTLLRRGALVAAD